MISETISNGGTAQEGLSMAENSTQELNASYRYDNYFPSEDILNSKFPSEGNSYIQI